MDTEQAYLKGSFWTRAAAFIIDQIIILLILFILAFILALLGLNIEGLDNFLYYFISIVYGSVLIWKYGATLGKRWLKLKVVNTPYQKVSLGKAILRESIGKFLSGILFSLGYFTSLIDKQKQTWHDKIAKTYVVSVTPQGEMIPTTEEIVTKKQKITFWILFLLFGFPIVALSIFVITYLFLVQPHQIRGKAMEPNYIDGQYYLTSKIAYRKGDPQRGDVIVFAAPNNPDIDYIERIVALPGETVELKDGRVYVNDRVLEEPYLALNTETLAGQFLAENQKVTVPQNQYFVLGDNRAHSSDSRKWGFASREKIVGKVAFCYYKCSSPTWLEKIFTPLQSSTEK
jgi:signal peptidase I